MKTALASDFDNTLYFMDTEERFRAQDVFEILFYQKRGGLFGICTGRSPDTPQAAEAILKDYESEARMVVHADGKVYTLGEAEYPLQVCVKEFAQIPQDAIYGISMRFKDEEAAAEAAAAITSKYGAQAAPYQNVRHVDIVAAGCSKGTGAARVKEIFGIDRLGGIGDSYNDLPLLQASDIGFTFASAPAMLREEADEIVLSVSQAIEKLG